jgi:AraC family L-rhamnose operon regulatory protein RhaS
MKSIQSYHEVGISIKELKTSHANLHQHPYFELIYILEGKGVHNINHNQYSFNANDVFLLTPEDSHTFEVLEPCKLCIIDFTGSFFSKSTNRQDEKLDLSDFFKRLEFIFHNHHNNRGNLIEASEKSVFYSLIQQLIKEKQEKEAFGKLITQNILFLLLHLVARNIQKNIVSYSKLQNPKNQVHEIMVYIQQNIYDKELIKLEHIANQFHKSADHLNRYFKLQTGSTLKDYITGYKLALIQTRLKYSDLTISEIAQELNFTDDSHLNKIFKKVHGITAKQYQKSIIT